MSEYAVVAGFVQFDPRKREVNGKTVTDVTIKAVGSQKLISITIWPEFGDVAIEKGDFLAADGKFSTSLGQGKDGAQREYINLSPSALGVTPGLKKTETNVVQKAAPASDAPSPF